MINKQMIIKQNDYWKLLKEKLMEMFYFKFWILRHEYSTSSCYDETGPLTRSPQYTGKVEI